MKKKMLFAGTALLSTLASMSARADACDPGSMAQWIVGSHRGCIQDSRGGCAEAVDLMVQPAGGPRTRDGSYVAIMLQRDATRFMYYVIDPSEEPCLYYMTPREVTADGEVGVMNAAPTLTLNINAGVIKNGRPVFSLTDSNSSNNVGYQGSMLFENKTSSRFNWVPLTAGLYGPDKKAAVQVGAVSDRQTQAIFSLGNLISGTFQLREKLPGLYTLKARAATAEGLQVEQYPRKIVVFVNEDPKFSRDKDHFILVDPTNDMAVTQLRRR